jgi:hypothetical protein
MEVQTRENEDGSGEFTFDFDLSVPEDRAGYRWFQVLDEAHGSDRGVLLFLLAEEAERRALLALRSALEDLEPPMPEDGTAPPLHLLSSEEGRVRDKLIATIREALDLIATIREALDLIELKREIKQAEGPI